MARFQLYCGLVRNGTWYNYAEAKPLHGGVLALLEGSDKTGAARLLNLMKGSIDTLYSSQTGGEEYEMKADDYGHIYIPDSWKIGYEEIKLTAKNDNPIIPESFFCPRCSRPNAEKFTTVEESWQTLIDEGRIDEFYAEEPIMEYNIELPVPFEIEGGRTIAGGVYSKITMRQLTINDLIRIQKNPASMEDRAAMTYATWDECLVAIEGMTNKDLNIMKRRGITFFSKEYLATCQENIDAIAEAEMENMFGIIADQREVFCKHCGEDIGGGLDFTNFFLALSPKRSIRRDIRNTLI